MRSSQRINVPGLGPLEALADSPPGENFWAGTFVYHDEQDEAESRFYIDVGADEMPDNDVLDFAREMMSTIDVRIAAARQLLATKLREEPGFFGVDAATAAHHLRMGEELLPFDLPEPTFHGRGDWQIRFAQSVLPKCETFGVSVIFVGVEPNRVDDLSDSVEIA